MASLNNMPKLIKEAFLPFIVFPNWSSDGKENILHEEAIFQQGSMHFQWLNQDRFCTVIQYIKIARPEHVYIPSKH